MNSEKRKLTPEELEECKALKRELDNYNRKGGKRVSQQEIADELGVTQGAISSFLNGRNLIPMSVAVFFAKKFDIPIEYFSKRLAAEAREIARLVNKYSSDLNLPVVSDDNAINVPHYAIRGSMGHGQYPSEYVEIIKQISLSKSELSGLGVRYSSNDNLAIVTGWGNSMESTIKHGDPLLVDRGISSFVDDGVYLFTWLDQIFIKRLQILSAGEFEIISDNPVYKPRSAKLDEVIIHAKVLIALNVNKV